MKITIPITITIEIGEHEFLAKAGEVSVAKGADAADPASRANEELDRQPASGAGLADGCLHGGKEEPAAADRHAPIHEPDGTAIAEVKATGRLANTVGVEPSPSVTLSLANGPCDAVAERPANADAESPAASTGEAGAYASPNNSADHREDLKARYRKAADEANHATDREIERAVAAMNINERCRQPNACKFGNHPHKITCFQCGSDWAAKAKKPEAA